MMPLQLAAIFARMDWHHGNCCCNLAFPWLPPKAGFLVLNYGFFLESRGSVDEKQRSRRGRKRECDLAICWNYFLCLWGNVVPVPGKNFLPAFRAAKQRFVALPTAPALDHAYIVGQCQQLFRPNPPCRSHGLGVQLFQRQRLGKHHEHTTDLLLDWPECRNPVLDAAVVRATHNDDIPFLWRELHYPG